MTSISWFVGWRSPKKLLPVAPEQQGSPAAPTAASTGGVRIV